MPATMRAMITVATSTKTALFCSSRHTAISVTSAISLLVGASLGEIAGGDTTRFSALAAGTALLVALIAFIAWLVKAGSIVNFISESVMVGFKCGVALFLASTQLPKLFGVHGAHGNFWENAGYFLQHLRETNITSLTIGIAALAVLVLGKIFLKNKPVALFVVAGGIVASGLLGLDARGVKLLGAVPQGLPDIGLPAIHWADANELLPLAFACFLLGAVETAAIGRTFAAKHGGRLDAGENLFPAVGILAIPNRYAVPPPNLPADAPVAQVIDPVEVNLLETLRHNFDAAITHRRNGFISKRFDFQEPLRTHKRLDHFATALAARDHMSMVNHLDCET